MANDNSPFLIVNSKRYAAKIIQVICFLLVVSCDLLNAPARSDYLENIDEEIAWANAETLAVTVAIPAGWGSSPQTVRCYDAVRTNDTPRLGYYFYVEFTPNSSFGFVQWLAFNSNDVSLSTVEAMGYEAALAASLNGNGVDISVPTATQTGAMMSMVTIYTTVPIMLVPFCDGKPQLDRRTHPPIIPIQSAFPYDQIVNLWFTLPIAPESITGNIRLTAVHTSDENVFGKRRGELFGIDGDITNYYRMDFPSGNRIDLTPVDSAEYPVTHLMLLAITVSVGPGIESVNGLLMDAIETISFQTDTSEAQKAYRPGVISASRTPGGGFFNDSISWNRPDIDRRFNRIATGSYSYSTVYIRFSVAPPDDAPSPTPNAITIIERLGYTLRGFSATGSVEHTYATTDSAVTYNMLTGEYTIVHPLKTLSPGIIHLVVLPWYDDGVEQIPPLSPDSAAAQGQYVTVVMDTAPPELPNLTATVSGWASTETNTGIHVFGSLGPTMILTVDSLADLVDNGGQGGIPEYQAWSLPWTMDDTGNLYWYVQIGEDTQIGYLSSPRLEVYNPGLNNSYTQSNVTGLVDSAGYRVLVKFEDDIGNVSPVWIDTGLKIKYSNDTIDPAKNLEALCNSAGNQITVRWTNPATSLYPELAVNRFRSSATGDIPEGEIIRKTLSAGATSDTFSVPILSFGNVRNGTAVSGVYGYEITVLTHSAAGLAQARSIWIYNIPDMETITDESVSGSDPNMYTNTVRISGSTVSDLVATDSSGKNFVLTEDIVIANHTPIGGDGMGTNPPPFQGKFYGNGNIIAVTGMSYAAGGTATAATLTEIGLFGTINSTALIRDLTVAYHILSSLTVNAGSGTNIGGVVGSAGGNTQIVNCIVSGTSDLKVNALGGSANLRLGGIAGYFEGSGKIENCLAALPVTYTSSGHTGEVRIGGVAGETGAGGSGSFTFHNGLSTVTLTNPLIDGVTVATNVRADKGANLGKLAAGGAVGMSGQNTLRDIQFTGGTVSFHRDALDGSTAQNDTNDGGGMVGNLGLTNIVNSSFSGTVGQAGAVKGRTHLGGLFGRLEIDDSGNYYIHNCTVRVTIIFDGINWQVIGGVIGRFYTSLSSTLKMTITNCFFEDGIITVTVDTQPQTPYVGGFVGMVVQGSGAFITNNCGVRKGSLTVNTATGVTVGGFSSFYSGVISNCFASLDINTDSTGPVYVGGFIAELSGPSSEINRCYATGAIYSIQQGNASFRVGGLVGQNGGKISNSYALGNVLVDSQAGSTATSADTYAGGIAGGNAGSIYNCFSKGQVSAQSRNYNTYAGGIAGYGGIIINSAALGSSVTVKASWLPYEVGRISGSGTTLNNNYALATMAIAKDSDYYTLNPAPQTAVPGPTTSDGESVSSSQFLIPATWTRLPTATPLAGPGFNGIIESPASTWNFMRIGTDGHPRLEWE